MSTKALVFGLLWVPLYFAGCKVRSGVDQSRSEIKSEVEEGLFFIGHCTKIASECKSSCPQRDGVALTSPDLCSGFGDNEGLLACMCPIHRPKDAVPPDSTQYGFIGCVPSPGECLNSCQERRGIVAQQNSRECESQKDFACYCKIH